MGTAPHRGEVWFVDLGMVGKPRYALVMAAQSDARLALASGVPDRSRHAIASGEHCPSRNGTTEFPPITAKNFA